MTEGEKLDLHGYRLFSAMTEDDKRALMRFLTGQIQNILANEHGIGGHRDINSMVDNAIADRITNFWNDEYLIERLATYRFMVVFPGCYRAGPSWLRETIIVRDDHRTFKLCLQAALSPLHHLKNRIFKSYEDIVAHFCDAWRKLESQPWRIISIGRREWANGF